MENIVLMHHQKYNTNFSCKLFSIHMNEYFIFYNIYYYTNLKWHFIHLIYWKQVGNSDKNIIYCERSTKKYQVIFHFTKQSFIL